MTDVIRVHDVSKAFVINRHRSLKERVLNRTVELSHREQFTALDRVSLSIQAGSTIGLVGHNGSGKSTLLKLIAGIVSPSSGSVESRGRIAALLELGAGFHPDLTGRENLFINAGILGLSDDEIAAVYDEIIAFAGIEEFMDTQVKFYSSGMYVRLAFAIAVHSNPDILLVDEVLAVGDEPFQRKCMARISQFQAEGRTIVLVSHSAEQVGALCDRVVVLDGGRVMYDGPAEDGLRVLREGYQLAQETAKSDEPSRASIDGITVEPASSNDGHRDVRVRIDLSIHEPLDELLLALSISTQLAHQLFNFLAGESGSLPTAVGKYTLEYELRNLPLNPGTYQADISIGSSRGEQYDVRIPGSVFTVGGEAIGLGPLAIQVDERVVQLG